MGPIARHERRVQGELWAILSIQKGESGAVDFLKLAIGPFVKFLWVSFPAESLNTSDFTYLELSSFWNPFLCPWSSKKWDKASSMFLGSFLPSPNLPDGPQHNISLLCLASFVT